MNCTRTLFCLLAVLMGFATAGRAEDVTPKPDPLLAYQTARADSLAAQLATQQRINKENEINFMIQKAALDYVMVQHLGDPQQLKITEMDTKRLLDAAKAELQKACDAGSVPTTSCAVLKVPSK